MQSSRHGPAGYLPALPFLGSTKQHLPSTTAEIPSNRFWTPQAFVTVGIILLTTIGIINFYFLRRRIYFAPVPVQTQTSKIRKWWHLTNGGVEDIPTGYFQVGKIIFDPNVILGRGCEGTVVYKGRFDGREVAVKRVVSDFFNLADREVHLLRESDTHPHVIRYFCMEADSQFRYIALELCSATLQNYVENLELRQEICLDPVSILEQATRGLLYLHSLNVGNESIKFF